MFADFDFTAQISTQQEILTFLHNVSEIFNLTGSRYFGTHREDSDYDFFTYKFTNYKSFLASLDFQRISRYVENNPHYVDENMAEVWRHKEAKIDIQIQKHFLLKIKAQKLIKNMDALVGVKKTQQHKIWNKAYKTVRLLNMYM
jgi:hypothetical protein